MEQSTDEALGMLANDGLPPIGELDVAKVLHAPAMLREQNTYRYSASVRMFTTR
jgi:hypothetical protein